MSGQGTEATSHPNYVKVYLALLVLFAISVVGPLFGHPWLTLVTAFGVAAVKATMVAAYFMHLNIERRYIWYLLFTMLAFMGLLFAGVAPDVLTQGGQNWRHVRPAQPAVGHH
jgi:caa(3)-type oxidase subunit IV